MNFLILGAGGIGSYFGTRLLSTGHKVTFVARGKQLEALQQKKLKLQHPKYSFFDKIHSLPINEIKKIKPRFFHAVLITTKSTSTKELSKHFLDWLDNEESIPYIISLQNGVDNEEIFSKYLNKEYIIGGLTRKIGAHIVSPGHIKATGNAETIIGPIYKTKKNKLFLKEIQKAFNNAQIPTTISDDIYLELWKKLIINNGVNAICALLKEETGVIMHNNKLSKLVYGLMLETAKAALNKNINISNEDINEMYELIKKFDSIKPSMLVDLEHNRNLELDEICGVVIENCKDQNIDAPYSRTISTLLEFTYNKEK